MRRCLFCKRWQGSEAQQPRVLDQGCVVGSTAPSVAGQPFIAGRPAADIALHVSCTLLQSCRRAWQNMAPLTPSKTPSPSSSLPAPSSPPPSLSRSCLLLLPLQVVPPSPGRASPDPDQNLHLPQRLPGGFYQWSGPARASDEIKHENLH